MNILSVSGVFPNSIYPHYGLSIKERAKHIASKAGIEIVAPIRHYPVKYYLNILKGLQHNKIEEVVDGLKVYHPRYVLVPKYLRGFDGSLFYLFLSRFIRRFLTEHQVDVLDVQWPFPDGFAALKWGRQFNKKVVITVRDYDHIFYFKESSRKKMVAEILQKADFVITVSADLMRTVIHEYGVKESNVTVVPNGIDPDKFYPIDRKEARSICGLDLDKRYIVTISRLADEKGMTYLLKAFANLNQPDIILVIVGFGPLQQSLINLSKQLGLSKKVFFIGAVSHEVMYRWYNAADIFCLPSLREGCPNVIIESLACGTPVVATRVGGSPELIVSEQYGLLVPPEDEASLAEFLTDALSMQWDHDAIAAYGRLKTWDDVANEVIAVYRKVLGKL